MKIQMSWINKECIYFYIFTSYFTLCLEKFINPIMNYKLEQISITITTIYYLQLLITSTIIYGGQLFSR